MPLCKPWLKLLAQKRTDHRLASRSCHLVAPSPGWTNVSGTSLCSSAANGSGWLCQGRSHLTSSQGVCWLQLPCPSQSPWKTSQNSWFFQPPKHPKDIQIFNPAFRGARPNVSPTGPGTACSEGRFSGMLGASSEASCSHCLVGRSTMQVAATEMSGSKSERWRVFLVPWVGANAVCVRWFCSLCWLVCKDFEMFFSQWFY